MNPLEAAAQKEIHCFDPSWKEGTLPLSQDCVKQFFFAGAAYERERAKGLVEVADRILAGLEDGIKTVPVSIPHAQLKDALKKWKQHDSK